MTVASHRESDAKEAAVQGYFEGWQAMQRIDQMVPEELDSLPFGAIQLSRDGTILRYNATEGAISGRDPEAVIGKNFFTEVAPCTNVQQFAGRFRAGVEAEDLNEVFPYLFDFRMEPLEVWVRLYYSGASGSAWVFITRRSDD